MGYGTDDGSCYTLNAAADIESASLLVLGAQSAIGKVCRLVERGNMDKLLTVDR